jgi:hypothetical protein
LRRFRFDGPILGEYRVAGWPAPGVWHRWIGRIGADRSLGEKRTEGKRRGRSAVVVDIIPPQDARALKDAGVAAVYMSKDFALNRIMANLVRIVEVAANRGK